jgi:hypothetical protein
MMRGGGFVGGTDVLLVHIEPTPDSDKEEVATLTQQLRTYLLDLDVDSVDPITESAPEHSKGFETLFGWLAVRLGKEGLAKVLAAAVSWTARSGHTIEVTYDGDSLKISGVTSAQQERIVNDFLARHTTTA